MTQSACTALVVKCKSHADAHANLYIQAAIVLADLASWQDQPHKLRYLTFAADYLALARGKMDNRSVVVAWG